MKKNKRSQKGITLIEILVTLIILSIGFLGLASVQLLGTRNVSNSGFRSLATIYAYDIVERMRANQVAVNAGEYNNMVSIDASDPGCDPCEPAERADLDLFEWNNLLTANPVNGGLPNGTGTIDFDIVTSNHTITITWSENVREENGPEVLDQTYSLTVML